MTSSSRAWRAVFTAPLFLFLSFFLLISYNSAQAEGFNLLINGLSTHKYEPEDGGEFNEKNWGLGIQYDWKPVKQHWVPFFTISALKDSYKRNSFYAGGGALRRYSLSSIHDDLHFGAGVIGFMMLRKDHHNRKPFLGILPALSLGTDKIAVNATYIPEVEPKLSPLWFFQLKLSFDNF